MPATAPSTVNMVAKVVALLSLLMVFASSVRAQNHTEVWTPPVTPDGQPDLQGIWVSRTATPLERPKQLEGKAFLTDNEVNELKSRAEKLFKTGDSDFARGDAVFQALLADPEHYKNPNATGGASAMIDMEIDNRTSLIIDPADGKIPWTPEGQQRQAAAAAALVTPKAADPEDLANDMRCLTYGTPRLGRYGAGPESYYQIVQTKGYVVMHMEYIHEARIIPLDKRPHLPPGIRFWNGDSRGHWEGNTLVVDTTNFSSHSFFLGSSSNLHMVERFTRTSPDTIKYQVTVDDLTTWARPWTAEIPLRQTQENIYEVACHEGNRDVIMGIFAAARAREK
jgi:hypothetical protein